MKTRAKIRGIQAFRVPHCKKCKDGRMIVNRPRNFMFCGFCGWEPKGLSGGF